MEESHGAPAMDVHKSSLVLIEIRDLGRTRCDREGSCAKVHSYCLVSRPQSIQQFDQAQKPG
jgi:hypothetical protein